MPAALQAAVFSVNPTWCYGGSLHGSTTVGVCLTKRNPPCCFRISNAIGFLHSRLTLRLGGSIWFSIVSTETAALIAPAVVTLHQTCFSDFCEW